MKRSASNRSGALAPCAAAMVSCAAGAQTPPPDLFGDPQPVRLLGYVGDPMEPFLSRDGRWLLFNNLNEPSVDTNLAPTGTPFVPGSDGDPGAWELAVMNVDGSAREQLTNNREQEFLPHSSPDGTQLLSTRFLAGGYGIAGSISRITAYDFATRSTRDLTDTGKDSYPVWSPDGRRIAFLSMRNPATPGNGLALWVMNADGSDAREIARPGGESRDQGWGDIAWSSQDLILIVVAENVADNACFKTRMDKIRPAGTQRTQITDGGFRQPADKVWGSRCIPICSVAARVFRLAVGSPTMATVDRLPRRAGFRSQAMCDRAPTAVCSRSMPTAAAISPPRRQPLRKRSAPRC